jgi:hypothetical protein
MGAYLALGIMKKVEIYRDNDGPSLETIVEQMGKKSGFNPNIYDFTSRASYWTWTLNQEAIAKGLIPLLEAFYKKRMPTFNIDTNQNGHIQYFKKTPADKWLKMNEEDGDDFVNTFEEHHGLRENLYFYETRQSVKINFDAMGLITAGKIRMEDDHDIFEFMESCMHDAFKDFELGSTLKLYYL